MKGAALWEQYQYYCRNLTEHSRKLGFAAGAICWFFKNEKFMFPVSIYWALACLVGFFALDVLQHLVGALVLRIFTRNAEKKMWIEHRTIDGEIEKPNWVDLPAFTFFILKSVSLLLCFAFLFREFYFRISQSP